MPSGPEHYAEGERLLQAALRSVRDRPDDLRNLSRSELTAAAHAHFAAATAAATALSHPSPDDCDTRQTRELDQWHHVAGTPVPGRGNPEGEHG